MCNYTRGGKREAKCLYLFRLIEGQPWCIETYVIGEGDGTPLQYSCLENPMDGGAWWAAVHGVAQSRTRLK